MKVTVKTIDEYTALLEPDRKDVILRLQKIISENIPAGFEEGICWGMPGFYVPYSLYPNGYHCKPPHPLGFIHFASQKNFISLYHMGLYCSKELYDWFLSEWPNYSAKKPDIGKSCLRFKKADDIPFELIGKLATKVTPQEWILWYETMLHSGK